MKPAPDSGAFQQTLSPTDFGRLRNLLEKHDAIIKFVSMAERREWAISAAKTWILFLGALYVVLTSSLREVISKWIK